MIKRIFVVLLLAIAALLIFAATRPDSFRVQRSISIQAPPEKIFALIDRFPAWEVWSPWEKIDPALKRTYSGPAQGPGARYEWQGNDKIGQGQMQIVASTPPSSLKIQIHFIVPFEATNTVEFQLETAGRETRVTQAMYGPSPFIARLMGIFFSMDKMVGDKYEEGLASLKVLAEKP